MWFGFMIHVSGLDEHPCFWSKYKCEHLSNWKIVLEFKDWELMWWDVSTHKILLSKSEETVTKQTKQQKKSMNCINSSIKTSKNEFEEKFQSKYVSKLPYTVAV